MNNIINQTLQFNVEGLSQEEKPQNKQVCFLQEKFSQLIDRYPDLSLDQAFYLEYCKLYTETLKLKSKVIQTQNQINQLRALTHLPSIGKTMLKGKKSGQNHQDNDQEQSQSERKKRIRRTANEIARHYTCKVVNCQKSYGSQGSLNQHIKLKHKQLYQSGEYSAYGK